MNNLTDLKNVLKKDNPNFASSVKSMSIFGICLHVVFLMIFISHNVRVLIIVNIMGILGYIFIVLSDVKKHLVFYSSFAFIISHLHSVLCVYYLGWDSGFYIYPFVLIPAIYFISMNVLKKDVIGHLSTLMILLTHWLVKELSSKYNMKATMEYADIHSILYILNTFAASFIFVNLIYSFLYEMRTMQNKLEKTVNTDLLTNLSNRRHINSKIALAIDNFKKEHKKFAIIIGDIDNFKRVNDTYGHDCGDLVLKHVANVLVKNADTLGIDVCRWGGEEFLILIRNGNKEDVREMGENLLNDIRNLTVKYNNDMINITMTFGCGIYDETVSKIEEVIKKADENLYKGKERTKDCLVI